MSDFKLVNGQKLINPLLRLYYRRAMVHTFTNVCKSKEGANKQVISSQADSLIKISRIWADFFPANTSNQPI
ncbi:hypothetical protein B9N42_10600 [Escherichia coli]|nr:hypothetical protein B9N42_10600 [Escherichia coli]RBT81014.1 hypothetical protein B9N41_09630 [Escherichia coli]